MAFQIKENKKESENKTIRFPLDLIEKIEKSITNKNVTFSKFVIQACEYALDNMEEENSSKNNKWFLLFYILSKFHFTIWVIFILHFE